MKPQTKSNKLDILNGSIWNKLPLYAIPVAATGILEQLFNASDIAIVGNFASTDRTVAIAAVGANSPVIGVILNLFIGLSLGTNVVIANAIGRNDECEAQKAVHTSILAVFLAGILAALFGEWVIGDFLNLLNVPADVFPYALLYIRIYISAFIFWGCLSSFFSILRQLFSGVPAIPGPRFWLCSAAVY